MGEAVGTARVRRKWPVMWIALAAVVVTVAVLVVWFVLDVRAHWAFVERVERAGGRISAINEAPGWLREWIDDRTASHWFPRVSLVELRGPIEDRDWRRLARFDSAETWLFQGTGPTDARAR